MNGGDSGLCGLGRAPGGFLLRRDFSRFFEPFCRRASSFCAFASLACAFRAIRGASTFVPSNRTAKCVSPRSMPTSCDVGGSGASGASTTNEAWYRPAASTVTVTLDGSDASSRDQRTGTSPIPGSRNRPAEVTRGRGQAVGVPELHTSTVRSGTDKNGQRTS